MQRIDELQEMVLRISPEPYVYLDEWLIHRLLTDRPLEYYRFVVRELTDIAIGHARLELPPKQVFSTPDSAADFRVMPCVVHNTSGIRKTVKVVGTNIPQKIVPDQITVGKAFVIHPEENFISHILEGCLLSSARTGICAAVAVELLSTSHNKITILGSGRVGYYSALYAAVLGGVTEICLADIDYRKAEQTTALLSRQIPTMRFNVTTNQELSATDVLVLATTSTQPVCKPPGFNANLIVSVGADTDSQSELDPSWAGISDIFVDIKDSARFGDLNAWQKRGLISAEALVDVFDVLCNRAPGLPTRPRIFVSTGSALFDNLTIGYLLNRFNNTPEHH